MITFSEFLINNGDLLLFEKSAFYKEVLKKLTPAEQMEFIDFIKNSDSEGIMKMIKMAKGIHHKKGHHSLLYPSGVKIKY